MLRLSTSREQRVRQLLHEEMGDRKPSQFLRHLKGLVPDVPDEFLCTIWASLPPHVQVILAGQTEGSLDSASHLADRIAMSLPNLPQRASPLRCLTTQPGYWIVSRSPRTKWPHCVRHKSAASHTPEPTPAEPQTHLRHATSAGITSDSGTERENASQPAPASRETPPAGVNGG